MAHYAKVVDGKVTEVIVAEADCLTAGVLSIQFGNVTSGSVTPAAGVYTVQVTRLEGPAPVTAV